MKTILVGACAALMLLVPATANAAQVQVFGTTIEVTDNVPEGQFADNITFSKFDPWTFRIVNDAGDPNEPLKLNSPTSSNDLICMQDNPRQVTCLRFTGGPPIATTIYTSFGDDTVTIGAHSPDETVNVRTHYGNDTIKAANGSADVVSCGPDTDSAELDAIDTVFTIGTADNGCESSGAGGGGSGGGGGGGGGGGAGGGSTPPPATPLAPAPALKSGSLVIPSMKLGKALKKGVTIKLASTIPTTAKATLGVSKKVAMKVGLGNKAVTVASGAGPVLPTGSKIKLTFTKKAKKKLVDVKSLPLKVGIGGRIIAGRVKFIR